MGRLDVVSGALTEWSPDAGNPVKRAPHTCSTSRPLTTVLWFASLLVASVDWYSVARDKEALERVSEACLSVLSSAHAASNVLTIPMMPMHAAKSIIRPFRTSSAAMGAANVVVSYGVWPLPSSGAECTVTSWSGGGTISGWVMPPNTSCNELRHFCFASSTALRNGCEHPQLSARCDAS